LEPAECTIEKAGSQERKFRRKLLRGEKLRTLITFWLLVLAVGAQQSPEGAAGAPPSQRQERPPENLKLLQPEEVRAAMRGFRTGLGVQCEFCHVQGNRASDEKPQKLTARRMIAMTRGINAQFPDTSKVHVSCYTCHRGAEAPLTEAPPPSAQPARPAPPVQ
jgi:hypothetical protein